MSIDDVKDFGIFAGIFAVNELLPRVSCASLKPALTICETKSQPDA